MSDKHARLQAILSEMDSVVVAFSGGIDSTLVARVARDCLGDRAVAVTAISPSLPRSELAETQQLAREIGIRHVLIESHEVEKREYQANEPSRCYFCKTEVYDELTAYAQAEGYRYVADGANLDDVDDHRPGRKAAAERGVRSPLQEAGLNKLEIRNLARRLGLSNWNKPAAACLSSRIPYGTRVTVGALAQIEAAEEALRRLGLRQLRVRHHELIARIEVESTDFLTVLAHQEQIVAEFKALGYLYVTLDLAGFRSGSMNEALKANGRQVAPLTLV